AQRDEPVPHGMRFGLGRRSYREFSWVELHRCVLVFMSLAGSNPLSAQSLSRFAKLAVSHSNPRSGPATVQPATKPLSASPHPLRASAAQNLSHCDSLLSGLCNKNSTE